MGGKGSGTPGGKPLSNKQKNTIASDYENQKKNLNQLAQRYKVHPERIKEVLAEKDIPIKRKGRQPQKAENLKSGGTSRAPRGVVHVRGCMAHIRGGKCHPNCG